MEQFKVDERVTYYPPQAVDDNLHWPAVVVGISPSRRYRIEVQMPDRVVRRAVSGKRLARQHEISLDQ